jgi:hypothetical protein
MRLGHIKSRIFRSTGSLDESRSGVIAMPPTTVSPCYCLADLNYPTVLGFELVNRSKSLQILAKRASAIIIKLFESRRPSMSFSNAVAIREIEEGNR